MVTLREGSCADMALRISNSLFGLFIIAEPQPRLQTRSMGQAEFKSCGAVSTCQPLRYCNQRRDREPNTYHKVRLYFVLQNLQHERQITKDSTRSQA